MDGKASADFSFLFLGKSLFFGYPILLEKPQKDYFSSSTHCLPPFYFIQTLVLYSSYFFEPDLLYHIATGNQAVCTFSKLNKPNYS